MLHRRRDKDSHLDTILYEIAMLRHCSKTLAAKKTRKSDSDEALAEYNLVIEGFLLHFRNLLGFFTTLHSEKPDDLRLDRPDVWFRQRLTEKTYSGLRNRTKIINTKYSETFKNNKAPTDCYTLISKFLQHCTVVRYEQAVLGWKIDEMFLDIDPILADFEKQFPAQPSGAPALPLIATPDSSTTTTFIRHSASILFPVTKKN